VIEYSGNDFYFEGEKAVNQGSGFLGCGILIDGDGDDIYHGSDYAQGVGLFGIGILYDAAGNDDYRAGIFSQAAGNVGIGILMDQGEEDDRYFAEIMAFSRSSSADPGSSISISLRSQSNCSLAYSKNFTGSSIL